MGNQMRMVSFEKTAGNVLKDTKGRRWRKVGYTPPKNLQVIGKGLFGNNDGIFAVVSGAFFQLQEKQGDSRAAF